MNLMGILFHSVTYILKLSEIIFLNIVNLTVGSLGSVIWICWSFLILFIAIHSPLIVSGITLLLLLNVSIMPYLSRRNFFIIKILL